MEKKKQVEKWDPLDPLDIRIVVDDHGSEILSRHTGRPHRIRYISGDDIEIEVGSVLVRGRIVSRPERATN